MVPTVVEFKPGRKRGQLTHQAPASDRPSDSGLIHVLRTKEDRDLVDELGEVIHADDPNQKNVTCEAAINLDMIK